MQGHFLNMIDKVDSQGRRKGDFMEPENNYAMFGWGNRPPAMGITGMNNRLVTLLIMLDYISIL